MTMRLSDKNTYSETLEKMQQIMSQIREKCKRIEKERAEIQQKLAIVSRYIKCTAVKDMCHCSSGEKNNTVDIGAPVFITARFRSGSTFLWNFFKSIPRVTAFYEPLQENLPEHVGRQTPAQKSHVGVTSYWGEYSPIEAEMIEYHRREFGFVNLLLEQNDQYPELEKYIHVLIHSVSDKIPVLQFNRVDFRLPWLRHHFPDAKIIHLYRNPRDQWFSMVRDQLPRDVTTPDINTNYDLLLWSVYLAKYFPFLSEGIESSYERHYYIWRLSELMGKRCADVSIDYDTEIRKSPDRAIRKLNQIMDMTDYKKSFVAQISQVETDGWKGIRPPDWFDGIEEKCERKLNELGLVSFFGIKPLSEIKHGFEASWSGLPPVEYERMLNKTIFLLLSARGETASAIEKINRDLNHMVATCNEVGENSQKVVDKFIEKTAGLQ